MAGKAEAVFSIPQVQKIGIYAIHNKNNGKYYIGSSVNIYSRMLTHARAILHHGGINLAMINDLNKEIKKQNYDCIEFLVLKTFEDGTITDDELRRKEWRAILKYRSHIDGYNVAGTHRNGMFARDQLLYCPVVIINNKKEKPKKKSKEKKKAVDNYRSKFDFVQIRLPKGMKEDLKSKGSINDYILNLIKADIDKKD